MKLDEVMAHFKLPEHHFNISKILRQTGVSYQRILHFVSGRIANPNADILVGLLGSVYPEYSVELGPQSSMGFQPPEGWLQHPDAPSFYYNLQTREVLNRKELRERMRAMGSKLSASIVPVIAPRQAVE